MTKASPITLPFILLLAMSIPASITLTGCSPHKVNQDPRPLVDTQSFSGVIANQTDPLAKQAVTEHTEALQPETIQTGPWWSIFNDATLNSIVEQAFKQNFTLAQAAERITQAEAFTTQARGYRLPQLNGEMSGNQLWDKEGAFDSRNLLGIKGFWDPDFAGRLKSQELARTFELQSKYYALETAKLSLTSEIANAYYHALEQQQLIQLLREQVHIDKELLGLIEDSFQGGIVSRVDVLQQQGQLADSESLLPVTEFLLRTSENKLDVLLGMPPDGMNRTSSNTRFPDGANGTQLVQSLATHPPHTNHPVIQPGIVPEMKLGIPSDLLLNRPDLKTKKALLIAADAELAVAIAERLPAISITANSSIVTGSGSTGVASSLIAGLVQPLLDWGIRKAEVTKNKSLYQEKLFDFTETYLQAIEEVENASYQIAKQHEYISRLETRRIILAETLDESKRRYQSGLTDYLPVLQALQELRRVERNIVIQKRFLTTYYISLHVALGSSIVTPEENAYATSGTTHRATASMTAETTSKTPK